MASLHLLLTAKQRNPRIFRERITVNSLALKECDIVSRYRLDGPSIVHLTEFLRDDQAKATKRSCAINPETQVLVGLRYLAKGSFLSEVADLHGISKSSASLAVESFVKAVNRNLDNVKFPTDINRVKLGFYRRSGIPNVLGAIDGTLIPILAPTENEAAFVCRKGYHAINVQAVADHEMRFVDIVAKWPGSQNDAFIFDNCALKEYLETEADGYLLGDSGYPLRHYLMTPLLNPTTEAVFRYNTHLTNGRIIVEKAFGVLKCLHKSGGPLLFKPSKSCQVTEACVRLHNFCTDREIPLQGYLEEEATDEQVPCLDITDRSGRAVQKKIIANLAN